MEITWGPGERRGDHAARRAVLNGALTIYAASAARDGLLTALAGAAELEVDLAAVEEMDTAGVQVLVLLKREAALAGARLTFTGVGPAVQDALDRLGLAADFADCLPRTGGEA
jgi:anti-sigma B factor antagonist